MILRIDEDMCGNEVYLGWQSVSEVWSLETVLSYRLSYSSASNCKHFYNVKYTLLKKIWMLYAEQHWTKAIDLKSAVERLYEKLGTLEFDADYEAIYGMEKYYTVELCENLREEINVHMLTIGLQHFFDTINKYISNSDTSDEEEYKAVEQSGEDSETTKEEESKKTKGESFTKPLS
ncbi:hypothetical protein FQA39_LY10869 [Lamprigera yunnana]|nr:hypothetical protein FQA39_LY10869 [Lamprigera yunnana]